MDADQHPDPFRDAVQHGLQRAVEVASCAVTAAQVYLYQQRTQTRAVAERDDRTRRVLHAQTRTERDAARAAWAPAMDPAWLRQASLTQTAQAWGTAMPYADRTVPWYEPTAATAMRKCEERLRELHPYAMARYDRLRADGLGPAEAMREAAPLFARPSYARDASSAPRAMLSGTGLGPEATVTADAAPGPTAPVDLSAPEAQERRGREIASALQARARTEGRAPLGADELRTVLETVTNLPTEVIERIARPGASAQRMVAQRGRAVSDRRGLRPWEHDFPMPIQEVVAAAAPHPTPAGLHRPAASRAASPQATQRGHAP